MDKRSLPKVVIVGRTNVGKSTLFNRLSVDVKSLTLDYKGVTRDFLKDTVCWQGVCFELIDTGGVSLRKTTDFIAERARHIALTLIEQADVILFVCDGKVGLVPEDREIAKLLHKLGKYVVLVINKIDVAITAEHIHEFQQLGFDPFVPISAQHGKGIADLFEAILAALPKKIEEVPEEEPTCKVVILGKPNVGKSSLINLLLKEERAIVADIPGTTREPIREHIRFYHEDIQVVDTPGLRKKRAIKEPIETLMAKSTLRAVEDADIVLLLIDVSEGRIVDQELKLAFYVFEKQFKGLIILFNKEDLLDEQIKKDLEFNLEEYDYFMKKIVHMYISCATGKNIGKILPLVQKIWNRYSLQLPDDTTLTNLFKETLQKRPLYRAEKQLLIYNARQVKTAPITIAIRVNFPQFFETSQINYLENILRRNFDLQGVPVKFVVRKS